MSLWCKDAETRDRTGDLQIFSLTLSQLSYRGVWLNLALLFFLVAHLCRRRPAPSHHTSNEPAGGMTVFC